ncbi:MAG: hypothetical protein GY795_10865 [Desulfobacterales bacterium]|nr:hypothetical protein [Desulfobacterales bacterium]
MKKLLTYYCTIIFCVFISVVSFPLISNGYVAGDINGNNEVDINDAIIGLKISTNSLYSQYISLNADVNGDNNIGIEEVVYVLQVISELRQNICAKGFWYDWLCYPSEFLPDWGLGNTEQEYYHNDRNYDWYIDQADTGTHSNDNCGPSSVTMAAKWYDKTFDKTTEDARAMYRPEGGWWYTTDIINYLNHYSIQNKTSLFENSEQLAEIIKQGCIIILCLDTSYIRQNYSSEERVDRFYFYSGGHFLIVKGSRKIDNELFFEVYDPNNWHKTYDDDTEKGENRHYRAEDIYQAVSEWWNYFIAVYPATGGGDTDKWLHEVDPDKTGHMWGK